MKIGVISDIHDDLRSFASALNAIQKLKCEQIVCLGDMVGSYVPPAINYLDSKNSHEVIELIKSSCDIAVIGNHDLHAIKKIPNHTGNYKFPKNWYRLDYFSQSEAMKNKLWLYETELPTLIDRNDRMFLIGIPELVFKYYENDYGILYSHYAYPDLTGVTTVKQNNPRYLKKHFKYMDLHKASISFSGHSHSNGVKVFSLTHVDEVPFSTKIRLDPSEKYWVNIPAIVNDGRDRSGFLTFDTETLELEAIKI